MSLHIHIPPSLAASFTGGTYHGGVCFWLINECGISVDSGRGGVLIMSDVEVNRGELKLSGI